MGFGAGIEEVAQALSTTSAYDKSAFDLEFKAARVLFFALFVEAVVRTVQGEDEIWLLETGPTRGLYVWERQA